MTFPNGINDWGNAVLRHDNADIQSAEYFIKRKLTEKGTDKETISSIIQEYKVTFQNHFVQTSHYINFLLNNRLAISERFKFCDSLFIYLKQFYPDNNFVRKINNPTDIIKMFNASHKTVKYIIQTFLDDLNPEHIKENFNLLNIVLKFYEIIEGFMIRYYGYSVVGVSKESQIITSSNNCDKKFLDELMQGYSLIRLQKARLVGNSDPYYELFPVMPTKDMGFPIEEYIEVSSYDKKMDNMRLVRVLQ